MSHPTPPPAANNIIPITGALALIARPEAIDSALVEQVRALKLFALTASALQRALDRLEAEKKRTQKELTSVWKAAQDALSQHLTGEPFSEMAEHMTMLEDVMAAGAEPVADADLQTVIAFNRRSRELYVAQARAERGKEDSASSFNHKIEAQRAALAKFLRHFGEPKQAAQPTLPNVDLGSEPEPWMDKTTCKTILDAVAYEVHEQRDRGQRATATGDTAESAAAARDLADREALLQQLRESGFGAVAEVDDDPEDEEDEDNDAQTPLDLDLRPEGEGDVDGPLPASDIPLHGEGWETIPPAPPVDPADHPALQGKIAETKAKRGSKAAAKRAQDAAAKVGSKRGRKH